jgi:FKBP-type peptidyl-prolyl cis-trans isomerase (trigger factor)
MGKLDELEVSVSEVVDFLRISGQFAPALHKVIERKITAEMAKEKGIEVTDEELQKVADGFRQMLGLTKAADTEEWLQTHGISLENLENYLETNVLVSKFIDGLEKEADAGEIMSTPEFKDRIRETAYQKWIREQIKE